LQGHPDDVNTQHASPIVPRESTMDVAGTFTHVFPPNSVTFVRIKTRSTP
jgi:hypothetical protein